MTEKSGCSWCWFKTSLQRLQRDTALVLAAQPTRETPHKAGRGVSPLDPGKSFRIELHLLVPFLLTGDGGGERREEKVQLPTRSLCMADVDQTAKQPAENKPLNRSRVSWAKQFSR